MKLPEDVDATLVKTVGSAIGGMICIAAASQPLGVPDGGNVLIGVVGMVIVVTAIARLLQ